MGDCVKSLAEVASSKDSIWYL